MSLLELVRLEGAQARKGIEWIHGAPVYRLRGNLLPLVFLNEQLQLGGPGSSVASLLDFEAARAELRGWLARAREAIKGHGANAPADLPPPAETTLGRWLSSCNDDLNALPTVELLRSACDAFFEGVSKITQAGGKVESHSLVEIESLAEVAAEQIGALQSYLETASSLNIVVLSADDRHFGLVVDEINDTEEIVVKPLSKQLKGLSVFAGATIMGDGRVALILDILGMAQRSGVVSQVRDRTLVDSKPQVHGEEVDKQTLLLVGVGEHGRMAIPLSAVARLEEFSGSTIERTGRDEVVQYRGNILPLLRLSSVLPESGSSHEADPMPVVVYSEDDRSVGLVVDRIIDIVEESVVLQRRSGRSGVLGSAIIQGRVTDVLDVRGLICKADPSFFEAVAA
ncbi:MAG: chemotaxis protein CheW [Candidatus Eisenbacteria bacterium]